MTEKLDALHDKFFEMSWKVENNKGGMSKELYDDMNASIYKEYRREYGKLDGDEGLKTDKLIADIDSRRVKQEAEIKIRNETAAEELAIRREEIVPALRKRFLRRPIPNYAMELAIQAAQTEITEYLNERESSVELRRLRLEGSDDMAGRLCEILASVLPKRHTKRGRDKQEARMQELARQLSNILPLYIMQSPAGEQTEEEQAEVIEQEPTQEATPPEQTEGQPQDEGKTNEESTAPEPAAAHALIASENDGDGETDIHKCGQ